MKERNMKKLVLVLLVFLAVTANVFSGEWDYVPNTEFRYLNNFSEEHFKLVASEWLDIVTQTFQELKKLPKEVGQAIWKELESYNLESGDVFAFRCGYDSTRPKAILVFLRIKEGNGGWTFSYYAVQHI
jgi:hypothetical protein